MELKQRNTIDTRLSKTDTAVLKGIAICGMLCWHLFYCPNPCGVQFGVFTHWIGIMGDVCVSAFLFASGYGLSSQFGKCQHGEWGGADIKFIIRRIMKFYSNYWVILAICLPIGILAFDRPLCETNSILETLKVWGHEILAISGHGAYNATWWFNTLIISLYLLFPIWYYGANHAPLLTLIIAYALNHSTLMKINMDMGIYTFIFVVGIVLAIHQNKIKQLLNKVPVWLLWGLCGLAIIIPATVLPIIDHGAIFYNGIHLYALLTVGIVMLIVLGMRKLKRLCEGFSVLGKHSANIYLIHTLIFYYWFPEFFYSLRYPISIFGVLMAICLVISYVLEFLKEKSGYYKGVNLLLAKIR